MPRTSPMHTSEQYGEKDFYLEEFRGRSVLFTMAPVDVPRAPNLRPLASAVGDLVRNETRVLLHWPAGAASERRLRAALDRVLGGGKRGTARRPAPLVRLGAADVSAGARLRGALWAALRRDGYCILCVPPDQTVAFPEPAVALAAALGVPKLVVLDPCGGLLGTAPGRLSFADQNVLDTLLRSGEAEWSGLGDRRPVLRAVQSALRVGVEAVNLCTPEGVGDELFTYRGSGTLFTRGDYCYVDRLRIDDFARAERLLERGQREGFLKARGPEEIAQVLGAGFGATIGGRHLAGVAGLLTAPYGAERAGEIVGLYAITRFKGEGIGERLVGRLLVEAEQLGLRYVFACAAEERAKQFFTGLGFQQVDTNAAPVTKWVGYDARRRARVAVYRRDVGGTPARDS